MKAQTINSAHNDKLRQAELADTVSILDCEVVKTLSSGIRTLRYILRTKPDIAILQETLGDVSAFEIAKEIANKNIETKCIIIFNTPTYENIFMARSLKIDGCFCEHQTKVQMLSIVHKVLRGEEGYCDYIIVDEHNKDALSNFEKLSDTEIKILTLMGFYKNTKKVAKKLSYSSRKIEVHQVQIASKLNIEASEDVLTNWAEQNEKLIKTVAFQKVS